MEYSILKWLIFLAVVATLLLLDLGVFNKRDHVIGIKESLYLSIFYIVISLIFGVWIYQQFGIERAEEYYTGYLIEKSLSMDNIFLISLIFNFMHTPRIYQHRVLFWGIVGVIILRGIMIGAGAILVAKYDWILYLFAIFLIYTGIRMLFSYDNSINLKNNKTLNFILKKIRSTNEYHGHDFFIYKPANRKSGKWYCTPLFITLIMIESIDVMFAVDSVPAIFAITTDTYVVYTSNIFAILGLRALYFALAAIIHRFVYLKYSLSIIMIFIGSKIFVAPLLGIEKVPALISLTVTIILLLGGILYSLYNTNKRRNPL